MRCLKFLLIAAVVALTACGPNESQKQKLAEKKRIECLDQFCEGDIEPKRDIATEVAAKLNGRWYLVPKVYGNPNFGPISFYWPSKAPANDSVVAGKAKEVERNQSGAVANHYETAIEVFISSPKGEFKGAYRSLLDLTAKGLTSDKKLVRPGLLQWSTREPGMSEEVWYVAMLLKDSTGDPPALSCRIEAAGIGRCTTGFFWKAGIGFSLRFSAKHASDWPEIYTEVIRVLNLIKEV